MQVMDRIQGLNGLKLPWEGAMPQPTRHKLGFFRETILSLLARNPAERPTMKEFFVSCEHVLAGSKTLQAYTAGHCPRDKSTNSRSFDATAVLHKQMGPIKGMAPVPTSMPGAPGENTGPPRDESFSLTRTLALVVSARQIIGYMSVVNFVFMGFVCISQWCSLASFWMH